MTTAVAVQQDQRMDAWDQMMREIRLLGKSKFFPHIQTIPQAVAIALMGRDLGISLTRAIYGINVIEGKPSLSAALMAELILKTHGGNALFYEVSDATQCTIIYKRKDANREGKFTYTIEDAARAGLTSKKPWQKDPTSMLRNRCLTNVARMGFADVIAGSYLVEEMPEQQVISVSTGDWSEEEEEEEEEAVVQTPQPANTVRTAAGNIVDTETGEIIIEGETTGVTVDMMSAEQRTRIAALQAAIGTTDVVEEMTKERAAQHIVELIEHLDKQHADKTKKTNSAKPKKATPAAAAPAAETAKPAANKGTVRDRLSKAQSMIAEEFSYLVYVDPEPDEEKDIARLTHLKEFYKKLVEGKGGAPLEPRIVAKLLVAFKAVDQNQHTVNPAVTVANVGPLASEMQWHYRLLQELAAGEDIDSGVPTAEQKAIDEVRVKAQLAEQARAEAAAALAKKKEEDPFGFEDEGMPL